MSGRIAFNQKPEFTVGVPDRLSPLVRRVIAGNPGPFTFTGTGTYIVGNGRVAVIDPGPADKAHIDAILAATRDEVISHILVTHTHIDHSPGCALLQQHCDAQTWGYGPHAGGRRGREDDPGADYDFKPDIVFEHGQSIVSDKQGDHWHLTSVHTPGHASNHLGFFLQEENALFCGDAVMGWSTTIVSPPDGSMKDYMQTLQLLMQRTDAIYFPTHGAPVTQPQQYVASLYQHRVERECEALECIAKGVNTIAAMVPVIYTDLDQALYPAAARSLFATLECLVQQRRLVADDISIHSVFSLP